ncbi:nucleoside phosphorylase domain-containing protein [Cladorrhinum samala]|uniref:Nucleoside phosphorylase domain-containing protein n=1 Tax=Cladorrhinum samala TaxID=585594 RepID=A0AAV9HEP8_9PEZI|nr:nucleoside phosphorylase domain-containing protein [Cladorrhinum samala]
MGAGNQFPGASFHGTVHFGQTLSPNHQERRQGTRQEDVSPEAWTSKPQPATTSDYGRPSTPSRGPISQGQPSRPASRDDFEIAIICALPLEVDAVEALFDRHWDDDDDSPPYDKAAGDPNAYSTGVIGRHNVVLAYMPNMGKVAAGSVASYCRMSFRGIRLALVVGICGAVPFRPDDGSEIVLGDVIVSSGVVQFDFGRQLPERFVRKDTLLDVLGRQNTEIRALLAKLGTRRSRKTMQDKMAAHLRHLQAEADLVARYPGAAQDKLFEAAYRHLLDDASCDACGCDGQLVRRSRLEQSSDDTSCPQPVVHFGLMGSSDKVMKSGVERDAIAQQEGVIAFEMEGAGVWDVFPCVVIKGACDYADSHKNKKWQRYAAATAAACMKAFLSHWIPLQPNRAY